MELEVKLGDIQARVDNGGGVRAHSCTYELALVGRSINGSSLGHWSERFWLPTHRAQGPCQRVTNSSVPLPSCLQAGRKSHLPIQPFADKDRWKLRYKRENFPPPFCKYRAATTKAAKHLQIRVLELAPSASSANGESLSILGMLCAKKAKPDAGF
jgi:hypothetical protein